jgi:hypothetical protein
MEYHGAVARRCLGVFLSIAGGLVLIDAIAAEQQPGESEMQSSSRPGGCENSVSGQVQ